MSEPRLYVREHIGYPIRLSSADPARQEKLTCYIIDRLYNCRVVETFEYQSPPGTKSRAMIRSRAERRCAELNRWWELELAS